jgi:hypothetical protein
VHAHSSLKWPKITHTKTRRAKLNNAEGALKLSLAALKEKRCDGAIAEAHKASQLARRGA